MANDFKIIINGLRSFNRDSDPDEFFGIFIETSRFFIPEKVFLSDNNKILFDKNSGKELWERSKKLFLKNIGISGGGGVEFKGKPKTYSGYVNWDAKGNSIISLTISIKMLNEGIEKTIQLAKSLFDWSQAAYGYGVHNSQQEIHYTPGLSYKDCLGGVTWMSLFGKPYVDLFGKEVIESAPCYVEKFSNNCYILLTSEEPCEPDEKILLIQERVKKHLGENAFWRRDWPTQCAYTFEDILQGKHRTNKEGYRSPNFSSYENTN